MTRSRIRNYFLVAVAALALLAVFKLEVLWAVGKIIMAADGY